MGTESQQTVWRRRSKRTTATALGLVAILAGIAIAYFLTNKTYTNNLAKGGNLSVDSNLPLNFTGYDGTTDANGNPSGDTAYCMSASGTPAGVPQKDANNNVTGYDASKCETLYPTNSDGTAGAPTAAIERDLTVTNKNSVDVAYNMFATCTYCVQNPTSAEATQFSQLYVLIQDPKPASKPLDSLGNLAGTQCSTVTFGMANCPTKPYYVGPLSGLDGTDGAHKANLGTITTAAGDHTYEVYIWLKNDPNNAQAQNVLSNWEFVVGAQTPVS
jgi:hypothetical protein